MAAFVSPATCPSHIFGGEVVLGDEGVELSLYIYSLAFAHKESEFESVRNLNPLVGTCAGKQEVGAYFLCTEAFGLGVVEFLDQAGIYILAVVILGGDIVGVEGLAVGYRAIDIYQRLVACSSKHCSREDIAVAAAGL